MSAVREFPKAAERDWQAAKAAAGKEGRGTVKLTAPGGAVAFFHLGEVSNSFGQRIDTHSYPVLGGYWQQPLGTEVNRFSVSGWIVGADYLKQRDCLSKVLHTKHNSDSPLRLELSTYEPLAVLFKSGSQKESGTDGGQVELSLEFTRVLNVRPTVRIRDYTANVQSARRAVFAAVSADTAKVSAAGFRTASKTLTPLVTTASGVVNKTDLASAGINQAISQISQGIEQSVLSPGQIINSLGSVIAMLTAAVTGTIEQVEREARKLHRYFLSWSEYLLPGSADSPAEQDARNMAINTLRVLGIVGQAENLLNISPVSIGDARALFGQLEQAEGGLIAPGGALHSALGSLNIAVREQLRALGWFELSRAEVLRVGGVGLSSLALAARLGSEEASIRAMNNAQNAFFIGGNVKYVPV